MGKKRKNDIMEEFWKVNEDNVYNEYYMINVDKYRKLFGIEEKKWKPKIGRDCYYVDFINPKLYFSASWSGSVFDEMMYKRGLVCRTRKEAVVLANIILKTISELKKGYKCINK